MCSRFMFANNHPASYSSFPKNSTPIDSLPKSVLMSFRVIRAYGFKKEQRKSSEAKCRDRFPNGPFGERTLQKKHARPALLTVFSTTQSAHLILLSGI